MHIRCLSMAAVALLYALAAGCSQPLDPDLPTTSSGTESALPFASGGAGGSLDPLPGQIVVDPAHPRWLWRSQIGPFFQCGPGDPEGLLYRGSRNADGTRDGDQFELIDKLDGTGANCVYLQAVRSHGGDGGSDHNPFVSSNPALGLDDDILDQWDEWFTALNDIDVVVYLFFYDDGTCIWDCNDDDVPQQEREFIQAIVERFEHLPLLVWVVAEEYQEAFSEERVSNIAAEIRAADSYNHPISVHKLAGIEFDEFADDPNIDQYAIQYFASSPEDLNQAMTTAFQDANGRYNLNMAEAANHGTGTSARKKNWATAMGGAYVMVFESDIAGTALSDLEDCGRLVRFMESTNFYDLDPHHEYARDATLYVLADPKWRNFILYSDTPGAPLGVGPIRPGRYDLTWFDPATGQELHQRGVSVTGGTASWTRPAALGAETAVWVRPAGRRTVQLSADQQP